MSPNNTSATPPTATDPVRRKATRSQFSDDKPGACTNQCPEYVLILKGRNSDREPFSKHPLPRSVRIAYRLAFDNKDPGDPVRKDTEYAYTADKEHERPLTEKEYHTLQKVYVWAEPYGYAALRPERPIDALAVGRLAVPRLELRTEGTDSKGRIRLVCRFDVLDSVPGFIASEMQKNVNDPDVKRIQNNISEAKRLVKEDTWYNFNETRAGGNIAEAMGIFARRVHKDEGWQGTAWDIALWGGGDWDHKPRILPVWGTDNRIGNSPTVYYYDIWSNIHYGYIGRAATLPRGVVTAGASAANIFDSGQRDEASDSNAISEGYDLYVSRPAATIDDVIALVESHKTQWDTTARKAR